MPEKKTKEELEAEIKRWGSFELNDGNRCYYFRQKHYADDFLRYFDSQKISNSLNGIYKQIKELWENGSGNESVSYKSIERYHKQILFTSPGEVNLRKNMTGKIIDMLLVLQGNEDFNRWHHRYLESIDSQEVTRFSYQWETQEQKWMELVNYDNNKKNMIIAGFIYELLDVIEESEFFSLNIWDSYENDYAKYEKKIKKIYSIIDELYINDLAMNTKWLQIMNPVKAMIVNADFPGVYDPIWVEANESITYFDAAYEIAESEMALFAKINKGNAKCKFALSIDVGMRGRRKHYIEKKRKEYKNDITYAFELQCFEEEMKKALKKIIANEFGAL